MKITLILLSIILLIAALLRIPLVSLGFFAFTFDQGRDLLEVQKIVEGHNLTLIGPTTGLPGIFYGPWWYYFLSPIYFLASGDPTKIAIAFTILGIANVILIYFATLKITGKNSVAQVVSFVAATSLPFLTASSQIWSPSLVLPLMTLNLFVVYKLFQKTSKVLFLTFGLLTALIMDAGAAFGVVLTLSSLLSFVIFREKLLKKETIFFFLGFIVVLFPRILFDLKNDFLISSNVLNWLTEPKVYQEQLSLGERLTNRFSLVFGNFAYTFTKSNKIVSLLLIAPLFISALKNKLFNDKFFSFLIFQIAAIFILFSLFPDTVWDYYLVGLPAIFLFAFAIILKNSKQFAFFAISTLAVLLTFNTRIFSPFKVTWQGDGAIYRNQKNVMENLKPYLKGNYSIYFYTPARFDYPFEYLLKWYIKKGEIDEPTQVKKPMYLVIRKDSTDLYQKGGWYGDKTRDKTEIVWTKDFAGSISVEKHEDKK